MVTSYITAEVSKTQQAKFLFIKGALGARTNSEAINRMIDDYVTIVKDRIRDTDFLSKSGTEA